MKKKIKKKTDNQNKMKQNKTMQNKIKTKWNEKQNKKAK